MIDSSAIFLCLLFNDPLKKADAIVMLCGDGYNRVGAALELYKNNWAKKIVISGGTEDLTYGSIPAKKIRGKFLKLGVPGYDLILEELSQNTKDQAVKVINLAESKKWKRVILVASHYHQPRAFLTFLSYLKSKKSKLEIINFPARNLSWTKQNKWGKRVDLLKSEFKKVKKYNSSGDVSNFKEGVEYLVWRQSQ